MKKLLPALLFAALFLAFAACGDENDEPEVPMTQQLESEIDDETGARVVFDIDLNKDSSSVYVYNAVFTIGERVSPPMDIRIDSPCSVDKSGTVYTLSGTGMIPYMKMGSTFVPVPSMPVTNFICTVNTKEKTYSTSFDCHGGHWAKSGKLK